MILRISRTGRPRRPYADPGGGGIQASSGPSGEALLAIAALAAIQLTAGKSDAQAAVLGAFFTMLGDAIGLLLAQRAALENP